MPRPATGFRLRILGVSPAVSLGVFLAVSLTASPAVSAAALPGSAAAALPAAQTAKQLYEAAQTEEKRLRASASAKRSRSAWVRVGRKYRAVVRAYPRSGYCDDALYYEGGVYRDAAERFSDRALAVRAADAYELLARGYPSSKWAPRALLEQVRLYAGRLDDPTEARRSAERLKQANPGGAEARRAAAILAPPPSPPAAATSPPAATTSPPAATTSPPAAAASPPAATISRPAAAASPPEPDPPAKRPAPASAQDRPGAAEERPAPNSGNADRKTGTRPVTTRPAAAHGRPKPADPPGTVENIRHWVGDSHTRVVIDLSREVPYTEGRLRNPDRVFFDLHGAALSEELARREFPIDGSHLQRIRAANHEAGIVRVVLDLSSIQEMSVFGLPDPYRLVVDIHGAPPERVADAGSRPAPERRRAPAAAEPAGGAPENAVAGVPSATDGRYSLARQLGANVRRIVVDAGHGGKDPGTHAGSLREKDIVLDIARKVRDELTAAGFEVIMTRDRDVFVPLEKRAFIANDSGADLFLSIHANAARSHRAQGLETFYLNLADSPEAEEVAARENATANVRMADMPKLIEQIMNNNRIDESRELAGAMQQAMSRRVLGKVDHPLNRGVKTAGFHVLLGAKMPAILVEVGFVSNRTEAKLLRTDSHRKKLATAIAEGVEFYLTQLGQTTTTATSGAGSPSR